MSGDLVGQMVAHFRVVERIGEGGMGVVYKATDEKLGRDVALKVLPAPFAEDAERRKRFLREAKSAAAVTHPNIAAVYEVGEADGRLFIAMELVLGESLRSRVDRGLGIPEAIHIAREIAAGLSRAHDRGVIHRDLKPENVMVSARGEVKLLDFGLAKLLALESASVLGHAETRSQLTFEGRVMGTPPYLSPEQARGEAVDARSDVFSFGVMLYEMLTGVRPFGGDTALAVLHAISTREPDFVSRHNAKITPNIEGIVARCLEKNRDARYASGQELADALVELVPDSRRSPAARHARSGPTKASGGTPTMPIVLRPPARGAAWRLALLVGALAALGGVCGARARRACSVSRPEASGSAACAK